MPNKFKRWLLNHLIDYTLGINIRGFSEEEKEDLATIWEESGRTISRMMVIAKHNIQVENMKALSAEESAYNRGQYRMVITIERTFEKVFADKRKQEVKKRQKIDRDNRFKRITKRLMR